MANWWYQPVGTKQKGKVFYAIYKTSYRWISIHHTFIFQVIQIVVCSTPYGATCAFFIILLQFYVPFYVKKEKMDNFMCLLATPDVMVVGSLTALLLGIETGHLKIKLPPYQYRSYVVEIRWSYEDFISTMRFPILVRWHCYNEIVSCTRYPWHG